MAQEKFRNKYRSPSARKRNWDYRSPAIYFITICTQNRLPCFGNINNGRMFLSEIGKISTTYWFDIPNHFPFIELINFVVMPNHIHGLLEINEYSVDVLDVGTLRATSLQHTITNDKNEFMARISPKRESL